MSSEAEQRPAKRGEAAWKDVCARVAANNDQARKDARARRAEGEAIRLAARKRIAAQRHAIHGSGHTGP